MNKVNICDQLASKSIEFVPTRDFLLARQSLAEDSHKKFFERRPHGSINTSIDVGILGGSQPQSTRGSVHIGRLFESSRNQPMIRFQQNSDTISTRSERPKTFSKPVSRKSEIRSRRNSKIGKRIG